MSDSIKLTFTHRGVPLVKNIGVVFVLVMVI